MAGLAGGFWGWYLDFIDAMGELRISGIPLALAANFAACAGSPGGGTGRMPPSRIQPSFDARIRTWLEPAPARRKGGHVALCTSLLRFPESVYREYFRREKAVIVADFAASGGGERYGLAVRNLRACGGDWTAQAKAARAWAEKLLRRLDGHPLMADGTFRERFLAGIPEWVRLIVQAEAYMERHPPGCLVVGTTELALTRVLALAARRRGIPVICLQHGVIAVETSYMPVFADIQAVYGPADAAWYAERGVSRRRLAVTGHPRFDPLFTGTPPSAEALAARLGLPSGQRFVLVATQPHLPAGDVARLVRELAGRRDVRVLIKPHPLEERSGKTAEYGRLAAAFPNVTVLPQRIDLHDVLRRAAAVVAESSTVGLEALMARRPLIVLKGPHSEVFERWGFAAEGPERTAERALAVLDGGMADAAAERALRHLYPLRLSGPALSSLIRRTSGIDCRPRISWLRDGMLLKGDGPAVWLIQGGLRRRVAGPRQLKSLMKKRGEPVRVVKPELLRCIPQGEPL